MQFETAEAKRLNEAWAKRQAAKSQKMIEDEGFLSMEQMYAQIEANQTESLTCKKCRLLCSTYHRLAAHQGSQNCKKRQADQKGEVFVPLAKTYKKCGVCNCEIMYYKWKQHLDTIKHREALRKQFEPAFYCDICDKEFGGKRPKLMLKKHLCSKKHVKRAKLPKGGSVHAMICKKHGFKNNMIKVV